MNDPLDITDKARLLELLAQRKRGKSRVIDEADLARTLKHRVRGQDGVVDDVARYIRLQWGKARRDKPVASFLFVGPPATGKTELAKALAEQLFDDEKNLLRFDCSELSTPESKTRLIGAPTGYVGAQQGGQLTRPMLANPRRLVLFDEIEKAHDEVTTLFLSMMGEGRVTEQGSGKTADFTQSVIVLTSNAEHNALEELAAQVVDPHRLGDAARDVLKTSGAFRPEVVSRFDRVCLFRPLTEEVFADVTGLKIRKAAEQYGVSVRHVEPEVVLEVIELAEAAQDTRQLVRLVDEKLGDVLIEAQERGWGEIVIRRDADGAVVGAPADKPECE